MAKFQIDIDDALADDVREEASRRGESENAVIEKALQRYFSAEIPAKITDPAEVAAIRKAAAGMWRDRTDLPDLAEMRRGWDERLERLFGND